MTFMLVAMNLENTKKWRLLRTDSALVLGFALLPLIAFRHVVFGGGELISSDGLEAYASIRSLLKLFLAEGTLPYWTARMFCGMPFLASFGGGVLEPTSFVFLFLDPVSAAHAAMIIAGMISLAAVYVAARLSGFAPVPAVFFPLLLIPPATRGSLGPEIIWFPTLMMLGLLALEAFLRNTEGKARPALVAIGTAQVLLTHPTVWLATAVSFGVYSLCRLTGTPQASRAMWRLVIALLAVIGLASILLVPLAEMIRLSGRSPSAAGLGLRSLAPLAWVNLVVPGVLGEPIHRTQWILLEKPISIPIPILAFLPLALAQLDLRRRLSLASLLATPLIFVGGFFSGPARLLGALPGVAALRHPGYWTAIMLAGAALATAHAAERPLSAELRRIWARRMFWSAVLAFAVVLAAGISRAAGWPTPMDAEALAATLGYSPKPPAVAVHRAASLAVARDAILRSGLWWTGSFLLLGLGLLKNRSRLALVALVVAFILPSALGARLQYSPHPALDTVEESAGLVRRWAGTGRVWSAGYPLEGYILGMASRPPYRLPDEAERRDLLVPGEDEMLTRNEYRRLVRGLPPNLPLLGGLKLWNGYTTMIPARLARFVTLGRTDRAVNILPSPEMPWNRLPGLTAVIATESLVHESALELVDTTFARIHRVRDPMPRFLLARDWILVPDDTALWHSLRADSADPRPRFLQGAMPRPPARPGPEETVSLLRESQREVVFDATTAGGAPLVLYDTYDPGWRVFVNGEERKLVPADHAFRAVWLEAGRHEVKFSYRPRSVALGAGLSVSTLLALTALSFLRRRRPEAKDDSGGEKKEF